MNQSEGDKHATADQTELVRIRSAIKLISDHLEDERSRIVAEIRAYPPPIPACDIQFNHLLERRNKHSRELNRLHRIEKELDSGELSPEQIHEFVESSDCIHPEIKFRLMTSNK